MKKDLFTRGGSFLLVSLLALALVLGGCSGDDGDDGAPGAKGEPGPPGSAVVDPGNLTEEDVARLNLAGSEITGVTINSPPVVSFKVMDGDRGIVGLTSDELRFIIAKLVPGTNGNPDRWQSYVNRTETPTAGKGPESDPTTQATAESDGTLVDNGDGSYVYTFATDVATATDPTTGEAIPYEPNLTHRVAIQVEIEVGDAAAVANPVLDFVPAGGAVTNMREIAMTASCNECHDKLAIHGGGRIELQYCVTCHNPGTVDANSGNNLDMALMTHKIHAGAQLPSVEAGGEYAIWGYRDSKHDYSHVGYPQDLKNCRKCHTADDEATPQGNNWKAKPNMTACGACHDDVNFATGANHSLNNIVVTSNESCVDCHSAASIEEDHVTPNATENNPNLLTGQRKIAYEIVEVTVNDANELVIDFRITSNGETLGLMPLEDDLDHNDTRWPEFLMAWAQEQGDIPSPADYNNLEGGGVEDSVEPGGQPIGIGIDEIIDDGNLTLSGGIYTATISNPFPADSKLRSVGLQSYFRQDLNDNEIFDDDPVDEGGEGDVALHTQSVVKTVTGDTPRRSVASSAACAACHEIFEAHGGNRVFTKDGGVEICTVCHVPNLSTSGRTLDLDHPEDTNNLKEMIHAIHATGMRTNAYDFVRAFRGSARPFTFINEDQLADYPDGHVVTYPGILSNCAACHAEDTQQVTLPSGVLPTTVRTVDPNDGVDDDTTEVADARGTLPNPTDWVNSPTASACSYCHDSELAAIHMEQNGGVISDPDPAANVFTLRGPSSDLPAGVTGPVYDPAESCVICHGPGASADVNVVHGLE